MTSSCSFCDLPEQAKLFRTVVGSEIKLFYRFNDGTQHHIVDTDESWPMSLCDYHFHITINKIPVVELACELCETPKSVVLVAVQEDVVDEATAPSARYLSDDGVQYRITGLDNPFPKVLCKQHVSSFVEEHKIQCVLHVFPGTLDQLFVTHPKIKAKYDELSAEMPLDPHQQIRVLNHLYTHLEHLSRITLNTLIFQGCVDKPCGMCKTNKSSALLLDDMFVVFDWCGYEDMAFYPVGISSSIDSLCESCITDCLDNRLLQNSSLDFPGSSKALFDEFPSLEGKYDELHTSFREKRGMFTRGDQYKILNYLWEKRFHPEDVSMESFMESLCSERLWFDHELSTDPPLAVVNMCGRCTTNPVYAIITHIDDALYYIASNTTFEVHRRDLPDTLCWECAQVLTCKGYITPTANTIIKNIAHFFSCQGEIREKYEELCGPIVMDDGVPQDINIDLVQYLYRNINKLSVLDKKACITYGVLKQKCGYCAGVASCLSDGKRFSVFGSGPHEDAVLVCTSSSILPEFLCDSCITDKLESGELKIA